MGHLQEPRYQERFLSPEEEVRLLRELVPGVRRIAEVALHTGIRRNALFGLRWRGVDWQLGQIMVPDTLSKNLRYLGGQCHAHRTVRPSGPIGLTPRSASTSRNPSLLAVVH